MQKNYLLQLCFLFLSISFLNSCRQELTLYEEANFQRESKFFENAESKTRSIEGGSEWIKILKEENSKNQFVSKLKDVDGMPIWDKITIDKSLKASNKSTDGNSEQRIIIPLTQDDIFMSSYIIASINAENEVTYLENIDNRKLYEIIHDKSISKEIRENIIANVIFINHKALGFKKFINIPGDLFSDIPLDSAKTTKTIKLVDEKSNGKFSSKNSSSKMMELMCISYETDDPNCSCHGTITVTKCFYVYVGGGSSGGGDGDGGTGSIPGEGGGGGSGSGTTNNTPWYLMNPDIDIYEYNGNVRSIFKSLTDYGIILQKEHVDYLQPKTILTSTIKNICLSNNTGYKSTFVYNLLDDVSFTYPQPDPTILNNKLTLYYSKIFTINPKTNWLEFWDIFSPYENTSSLVLSELTNDWNNPDIIKPTVRFKNNTKINGIYNQIKTASNFKQYLQNFEPTFSVAHLMFDIGNINNSSWLAFTSPPQNYWIKITFNKNKDWTNIPKVVIAETFMHEIIHAEIYRKLLSLASSNGNIDTNAITQQMLNHNYPGLFDYYVRYTKDNTDAQHNLMAAHYVSVMVNFLKQVYGTQYSDLVYKSIVWLDMKNTTAWNLLPQTERDLYQQTWDLNYWSWEK